MSSPVSSPVSTALEVVHERNLALSVRDGRTELLRYVYNAPDPQVESPRPYFHPLRSRAGDIVSVYRPWDHVWHKGLSLSLPHLGHENFWGGPTFVRDEGYLWLDNNGAMRHHGQLSFPDSCDSELRIGFEHTLRWITQGGAHVVDEVRRVDVELLDDTAWALVFDTRLRNVSGAAIAIGSPTTAGRENAGYGGLFWRGPRSFEGARIRTAAGAAGDEAMGTRSPWAALTGQHDESARWSTVVMVDDTADDAGHPVQWFARSSPFAALCPAPFFDEEYDFGAGEELRLRYAFAVADGQLDDEGLAHRVAQGTAMLARTRQAAPG